MSNRPNKYLIHDVYHLIKNLEILGDTARKDKIIHYAMKKSNKYSEEDIIHCINYFERIRLIKQVRKGEYVCLK